VTSPRLSPQDLFTAADLRQLEAAHISPEDAALQLRRLRERVAAPHLLRPCVMGDGLAPLPEDPEKLAGLGEEFRKASAQGRLVHFIPSSGAATRMGLANVPKAMAPFHRYGSRVATPAEEHIREAAALAGPGVEVRLHFTLSPEHELRFRRHLEEILTRLRGEGIRAEVTHSLQESSTQTLALDENGQPFRDASGHLLLRPGGHGALLANLEACGAEFAWIRNVDNIAVESHRAQKRAVHRALAGSLVRLASERRESNASNRPLRVCGMVANTGEPGGGPFWVLREGGAEEIRIVEAAEINSQDSDQEKIFSAATHFNPVDMICALRDVSGRPYRLADFSDPKACVLVNKNHEGRKLLGLEWPGLWNGGMAHWNTVCLEIPLSLFTPVKTMQDLSRPEHQEGASHSSHEAPKQSLN